MQFKIEQIAIAPADPEKALELLHDMGAIVWTRDTVTANGFVAGHEGKQKNVANLAFNYSLIEGHEFEVLNYTQGVSWIDGCGSAVSHIGMHCSEEELNEWIRFFIARGIGIAQFVETESHTNAVIKDKRRYRYVIFDTAEILGVDLKFIVRLAP